MTNKENVEDIPSIDDLQDVEMSQEFDSVLMDALDVDGVQHENVDNDENESPQIETKELLYPIIDMAFTLMTNWNVKEKDKKVLAEAYGDLLDKYFPNAGAALGVEFTALMVTGMVVMPHYLKGKEEKEVNEAPPQKQKTKKPMQDVNFADDLQEIINLD